MLSRVAERMYWLGRYIERAENTARMIKVNASLQLDLPQGVKPPWDALTDIMDLTSEFFEHYSSADERSIIKFILADEHNDNSLLRSIRNARENAWTTREILPSEAFELITELNIFANDKIDQALVRKGRHDYLDDIINQCYQLTGLLFGTMSHDLGYRFVRLGRNIERADMTTRILDVGSEPLLVQHESLPDHCETALWMNVLRSLSAYQMYHQHVMDRVNGENVVEFLLKDIDFPRSVSHCIAELGACFADLPRSELPTRALASVVRRLADGNIRSIIDGGLRNYIDQLQIDIAEVHTQIVDTWFSFDYRELKSNLASND